MSSNGNEAFSSPRSVSRSPHRGAGITTPSPPAYTTPVTSPPQEQRRRNIAIGPVPTAPNDIRKRLAGEDHRTSPPTNTGSDRLEAQIRFLQNKLNEQEEQHRAKVEALEHEIVESKIKAISPKYVDELETQNDELCTTNESLLTQIEVLRTENRKLNLSNAWQQREIDHISQQCANNGAAIQSVAIDQQSEFIVKFEELKGQLEAAQEENAEWYDKCMALQQENDDLKAIGDGSAQAISARLKLIDLVKYRQLDKEEIQAIKMELNKLNDDLHKKIEYKMLREGSMLFDVDDRDTMLDAQQLLIEQSKETILEQEKHIEELMAIVERHGEQLAERISKKNCGQVLDLETELDAAETLSIASSTDRTVLLPHRELRGNKPRSELNIHDAPAAPRSVAQFFGDLFANLVDGYEYEEDLIWPSTPEGQLIEGSRPINGPRIEGNRLLGIHFSPRVWTEMISLGRTYHIKVADDDKTKWITVCGPMWWSLIVQLLSLMLVSSLSVAYWCIMTASAERELWLDANEITMKRYWDTAVWGVERGILWRLHYGLGLV